MYIHNIPILINASGHGRKEHQFQLINVNPSTKTSKTLLKNTLVDNNSFLSKSNNNSSQ